jgi:hypothetical protein
VGARTGLNDMETILDPSETRTPTLCRPVHRQSLYLLRYPSSDFVMLVPIQPVTRSFNLFPILNEQVFFKNLVTAPHPRF